jgi:hypothetical protein
MGATQKMRRWSFDRAGAIGVLSQAVRHPVLCLEGGFATLQVS